VTAPRPTDAPDWASGAGPADLIEPEVAKQVQGFTFKETPTYQLLNWAWNRFAAWATHLSRTVSTFPAPLDLYNATLAGGSALLSLRDTALVDGSPTQAGLLEILPVVVTLQDQVSASGRSVAFVDVIGPNAVLKTRPADLSATEITYRTQLTPVTTRVLNDGAQVLAAFGSTIFLYDHDTAAVVWSAVFGSIVRGLAWDEARVYAVGSTAAAQLRAYSRSAGTLTWSYNHNADLHAVGMWGDHVYVHGDASAHASAATLRAIRASSGFDVAGEGGLGTDDRGTWDTAPAVVPGPTVGWGVAVDSRDLFAVNSGNVRKVDKGDGTIVATANVGGAPLGGITFDTDYLIVAASDSFGTRYVALNRYDLTAAWWTTNAFPSVVGPSSDGHRLYGGELGGDLEAYSRGTGTRLWRFVDTTALTETGLDHRQIVTPATTHR
jgi:hypothetical protein